MSTDRIMLIDASGFIYRAYHAYPPLTRPDGTPFGAVYGFTSMLMKLLTDSDAAVAVVFDHARKTFRNDIYSDYKANRPPSPADLSSQLRLVRDATAVLGLTAVSMKGFEADDLIATYARLAAATGADVTIVSSDKDLMQLVSDKVTIFDPMKSVTIGPAEVFEKFGVQPNRVIDVQSLAGDTADNIPGVEGIGVGIAAQLINEYGDLEGVLSNAGRVKQPARRANLLRCADLANLSRDLVTLRADVPVTAPLDAFNAYEPDLNAVAEFLKVRQPAPGFYAASLAKGAPVVGVLINDEGDVLVNGEPADHLRIWAARFEPISEPKYKYLIADRAWARENAPHLPEANPYHPVGKTTKTQDTKAVAKPPAVDIREIPIENFMP